LADAVTERGLRIGFGAQFRPHALQPKVIDALTEAGLAWAFVGVESDDPDALRAWRRRPVKHDAWRSISHLRERQVEVEAGIILFHPEVRLRAVRRLVDVLVERGLLNYRTATSRLHLLPGSHLYDLYKSEGSTPTEQAGPFTPPIQDTKVEALWVRLVQLLAPLKPCWVHAACQLPALVSQNRAGRQVARELGNIRGVLGDLNAWVRETLDTLVTNVERGVEDVEWAARALEKSREISLLACDRLESGRLVSNPQQLRQAIALEGGV
jgi:hypothetical protein